MKAYVIIFLVVLALTCWLNGGGEPYPYKVGISGVTETGYNTKREAGLMAELNFVDKPRNVAIMTRINEKPGDNEEQIVDFPLDARN
jgi:hypothetical protein